MVIRQDDVRFPLQFEDRLQEEDVGAARGGGIADAGIPLPEPVADRLAHGGLELWREPRTRTLWTVDHVSDKDGHARDLQAALDRCLVHPEKLEEEPGLAPGRVKMSKPPATHVSCLAIPILGFGVLP